MCKDRNPIKANTHTYIHTDSHTHTNTFEKCIKMKKRHLILNKINRIYFKMGLWAENLRDKTIEFMYVPNDVKQNYIFFID